ncbi:MAG: metallophosphoesterase [Opitutales bacterium]
MEKNEHYLERLPPEFDGFTLLQLSDLHADLHPDFPAAAARALAPLQYDCTVITGDFRTCTFSDPTGATAATVELLRAVRGPVFAVLGNHDALEKVPVLEKEAGLRFLLNENVALRRGSEVLHLAGVDDPNFYKCHDLQRAASGIPDTACRILLSHSPQIHREAAARDFDLLLAGHTHGGQICLPGGAVVVHDGTSPRRLLAGPWREGRMLGYTSRGTGATGLPVRLNCPAEVTLHVLRRAR